MNNESLRSTIQAIEETWMEAGAWSDYAAAMRQVLFLTGETGETGSSQASWLPLPGLCCQAVEGDASLVTGVTAAWACLQAAAHALDKVEDLDPFDNALEGLSVGEVINVSNGLVFTAFHLLNKLYQRKDAVQATSKICGDFSKSLLDMAGGQHRDLSKAEWSITNWMAIAGAKSGAFFGLACRSGGRLGSANGDQIEAFGSYGYHLGILVQLRDDITDIGPALLEGKRPEELNHSLAVAYAREVMPEVDKKQLASAIENLAGDVSIARELAKLLDRCGAALYLKTEIEKQRRLGLDALKSARPVGSAGEKLAAFLTDLIEI